MSDRIGIMGGTFDPIHYGHLVLSEQVRCEFGLEKIVFVPSGTPPHKQVLSVSNNTHRYLMTVLATIHNPAFKVSDIEVKSNEISYTVNTIYNLQRIYGKETKLFFITGADAILGIETWKEYKKLLNMCHFIAGTRPGHNHDLKNKIESLEKESNGNVSLLEVPALAISSSDIRNRVHNNKSIKYLVPDAVEQYIYKNRLYK